MDEPFGALDALTRASLQDAVMAIQAQLNNTVVMITHDVDEAVMLADRVVVMTNGPAATLGEDQHGRAEWRERVWQYVGMPVVAGTVQKKTKTANQATKH